MKQMSAVLLILLALSGVRSWAQVGAGRKTGPAAATVDTLGRHLDGSSSLFYWQGRLWTLNDHGEATFFALDSSTAATDTLIATRLPVDDMEAVAQDEAYFYLGDFGNGRGVLRDDLRILRLAKEGLLAGRFEADTLLFTYPGYDAGATTLCNPLPTTDFDCEAMVAAGDSLYLFTKEWTTLGTACYALPKTPGRHTARPCARMEARGLVTGAWLHPEACLLVLCGYSLLCQPMVWLLYDYEGLDFFGGQSRRLPLANNIGTQTEAIASADGLHYHLTCEHFSQQGIEAPARLLRLDLSRYLEDYLHPDTSALALRGTDRGTPLRVYPNPAGDEVVVELADTPASGRGAAATLHDTAGRLLLRQPLTARLTRLPLGSLPAGPYRLRVALPDGSAHECTIVKK